MSAKAEKYFVQELKKLDKTIAKELGDLAKKLKRAIAALEKDVHDAETGTGGIDF